MWKKWLNSDERNKNLHKLEAQYCPNVSSSQFHLNWLYSQFNPSENPTNLFFSYQNNSKVYTERKRTQKKITPLRTPWVHRLYSLSWTFYKAIAIKKSFVDKLQTEKEDTIRDLEKHTQLVFDKVAKIITQWSKIRCFCNNLC